MRRKIARISGLILLVAIFTAIGYAQPTPVLASLRDLPEYIAGGSIRVEVNPDFSSYDPDSAWFQFRRESYTPDGVYDFTSEWRRADNFTFTGAEDGTVAGYHVRVAASGDTSAWSPNEFPSGETFVVMHDLNPPAPVSALRACWNGTAIHLHWTAATDAASGIGAYYVLRTTRAASHLDFITEEELEMYRIAIITPGPGGILHYADADVVEGEEYSYTIVPMDRVGYYCPDNDVMTKMAGGPYDCVPFPPAAPLKTELVPEYTDAEDIWIEINEDIIDLDEFHVFRYMLIDVTTGDSTITSWVTDLHHVFDLVEECHTYRFEAQCSSLVSGEISSWSHSHEAAWLMTIRDTEGPENADSIGAYSREAGIMVQFYLFDSLAITTEEVVVVDTVDSVISVDTIIVSDTTLVSATDPEDLDCGSGWNSFHLFRVHVDSLFPELLTNIGDYIADYRVAVYDASYPAYPYSYWDDGPHDLDIDLIDEECYVYFVFALDNIGHWSLASDIISAEACVDKGVAPPELIDLPLWTAGTEVEVEIIDTTYCDMTEIEIECSSDPEFMDGYYANSTWLLCDDGALHETYPVDYDCDNIDMLSYFFRSLPESRLYFRARAKDDVGSISEWSNIVYTNMDASDPSRVTIDSIRSRADHTDHIVVDINWRPAYDSRSGLDHYEVYHSTDPLVPLMTHVSDVSRFETYFRHETPDPADVWSSNYYTILSVDLVGNKNIEVSSLDITGFPSCSPPHTPVIDTIYYEVVGADRHYVIEWTDPTPTTCPERRFHTYKIWHSNYEEWLFIEDFAVLIDYDGSVTGRCYMEIPREAISYETSYFHMTTTNITNNESGYSEIYEYVNEVESDSFMLELDAGWNLISIPVFCDTINAFFDRADITDIYKWDPLTGGYLDTDLLLPGYGYWVLVPTARTIRLEGLTVEEINTPISNEGWFLVGSTYYPEICFGTTGSLLAGPWKYNTSTGGYDEIERLNPGEGYWVFFTSAANSWFAPATCKAGFETFGYCDEINLNAGDQNLSLAMASSAEDGLDRFDMVMPPLVPGGVSNAYLMSEDGYRLIKDARSNSEWLIYIEKMTDLNWSGLNGSILIEGENYGSANSVELDPGVYKLSYQVDKADNFELVGAYPNPFNSATNIVFNVPEQGDVKVEIFDHLGRQISTLYEGNLNAGRHSMIWNGTDEIGAEQASGVFFCRLSYDNQSATKRLLYVR